MNKMKKYRWAVGLVLILSVLGSACTSDDKKANANKADEATSDRILNNLQKAHPTPQFERSQLRANLIDIATAQAEATQTTSFFFLEGVPAPIGSCPSIGFPIPSTAQLTNPMAEKGPRESRITLPQVEPTGIYTGDSSGTYIICVDARGEAYARYWEGYVQVVSGPAEFRDGQVVLVGSSSFDFSENEGER